MTVTWQNPNAIERLPTLGRQAWQKSPRLPWRWVVLGLGIMLMTSMTSWPATWLARQIEQASQQRVLLADAEGTLWNGNAVLALQTNGQHATALPGRLSWKIRWAELLEGHIGLTVQHSQAMPQAFNLSVGLMGLNITPGQLALPTSLLDGLGAPFNTLRLNGVLQLQWPALHGQWQLAQQPPVRFDNGSTLKLTAEQISSSISAVKPLGSYTIQLKVDGNATQMQLSTLQGPLMLQGQGQYAGGQVNFQGEASAAAEKEPQLLALLSILGKRQGNITRLQY